MKIKNMNINEIDQWRQRLEETFHGPNEIVGERLMDLKNIEDENYHNLLKNVSGYICIMDSFLDFYIETLQNIAARNKIRFSELNKIYIGIHISNFWRYRSSYLIFLQGYFIDALSLLRGVIENAFDIASLQAGIITIDSLFGELKIEDCRNLSNEDAEKIIKNNIHKADKKVKSYIMGQESGFSKKVLNSLNSFLRLMHKSVHKSKINILSYYLPWAKGKSILPIFPIYNETLASLYVNSSQFIAWMLLRTFPLLQIYESEFSKNWHYKYKVLNESFQEAIANFPKQLGRSIEELIEKKFNFYSS